MSRTRTEQAALDAARAADAATRARRLAREATTYLTHRREAACLTAPEDRTTVAGEIPTCADCRSAFLAGYCPGFNLYDVQVIDRQGSRQRTIRVAADNESNARFVARNRIAAADRRSTHDGEWPARFVSTNPAADVWKAARDQ